MAKTVAEKLLIKPNTTVWTSDPALSDRILPLPGGATQTDDFSAAATTVIFVADAASARAQLTAYAADLAKPAAFWIAYPKANRTDINRDSLWPIVTEYGMRPISQVAIDEVWSALRFRMLEPGETFALGKQVE